MNVVPGQFDNVIEETLQTITSMWYNTCRKVFSDFSWIGKQRGTEPDSDNSGTSPIKAGLECFTMAGNYSTIGIQLLLTRRVNYCYAPG